MSKKRKKKKSTPIKTAEVPKEPTTIGNVLKMPITIIFFVVFAVLCYFGFGLTWLAGRNWIFLCCLYVLSVVDLESLIIPNECLIVAAAAWVLECILSKTPWQDAVKNVLAAVIYGGGIFGISLIMDKVLKRDSMGGGDIKLFALCGLYLGLLKTLFMIIVACFFGLVFAWWRSLDRKNTEKEFPFGPSIALATAVMLFFGDKFVNFYTQFLH